MMDRRDFEAMASEYAFTFAKMAKVGEISGMPFVWDNLMAFTVIATESNRNFSQRLFMATVADRLREIYNRKGLPEFNSLHYSRFGRYAD